MILFGPPPVFSDCLQVLSLSAQSHNVISKAETELNTYDVTAHLRHIRDVPVSLRLRLL